jgi:hypothetical protein
MNTTITLDDNEQFFFDNSGWAQFPDENPDHARARNAMQLAQAERLAVRNGWHVCWVQDSDALETDPDGGPVYGALLRDGKNESLGSLWGITLEGSPPGDPYCRVVAAELADEAL